MVVLVQRLQRRLEPHRVLGQRARPQRVDAVLRHADRHAHEGPGGVHTHRLPTTATAAATAAAAIAATAAAQGVAVQTLRDGGFFFQHVHDLYIHQPQHQHQNSIGISVQRCSYHDSGSQYEVKEEEEEKEGQ